MSQRASRSRFGLVDLDIEGEFVPDRAHRAGYARRLRVGHEHRGARPGFSRKMERLTIVQGGLFECREGEPYLIRVAAGLEDQAGRKRQVDTEYVFR